MELGLGGSHWYDLETWNKYRNMSLNIVNIRIYIYIRHEELIN